MTILGIFPRKVIFMWRGAHEVRWNPFKVRLKRTFETEGGGNSNEHQKTRKRVEGVLDLQKSGNELSYRLAH